MNFRIHLSLSMLGGKKYVATELCYNLTKLRHVGVKWVRDLQQLLFMVQITADHEHSCRLRSVLQITEGCSSVSTDTVVCCFYDLIK